MENSPAITSVPVAQPSSGPIPNALEICRNTLLPMSGYRTPLRPHGRDCMDNLETLNALLDMTKEAEELASDVEKSEHLRSLVVQMRSKAKEERTRLRRDHRMETRYELCMIGILEELDFGRVSWQNVIGLEARLGRIREEIDRTIQEIKSNRLIM
jgi:hypothetical protein